MLRIFLTLCILLHSSLATSVTTRRYSEGHSLKASNFHNSLTLNNRNGWTVLGDNFTLKHWTYIFKSRSDLESMLDQDNRQQLRNFVASQVFSICKMKNKSNHLCSIGRDFLQRAYIEEEVGVAYLQMALWMKRLDSEMRGDWFSFKNVETAANDYLNQYFDISMRLFKGFNSDGVLTYNAIPSRDLPVVVNLSERSLTIWSISLRD
jgi:hypothetical protein